MGSLFMSQVTLARSVDRPHAQRNSGGKWHTVFVTLHDVICVLARDESWRCS